jgi:protein SCO1/2
MAMVEASAGRIGTPVDQMLMYCFHYDPQTGKYSANILNIIRAAGILTLFGMAAMLIVMTQRGRQRAGVVP